MLWNSTQRLEMHAGCGRLHKLLISLHRYSCICSRLWPALLTIPKAFLNRSGLLSCWYSLSCRRHFYFTGKYSAHMCTDLSQCVCTLTEDISSVRSQASCPILLWYIAQATLIRNTFRIEAARLQEANVSIFGVQPWTWVQPFWWVRSRFLASFSNICWKLKKKGNIL